MGHQRAKMFFHFACLGCRGHHRPTVKMTSFLATRPPLLSFLLKFLVFQFHRPRCHPPNFCRFCATRANYFFSLRLHQRLLMLAACSLLLLSKWGSPPYAGRTLLVTDSLVM